MNHAQTMPVATTLLPRHLSYTICNRLLGDGSAFPLPFALAATALVSVIFALLPCVYAADPPTPPPPVNAPPTIVDFTGTRGLVHWTFSGQVLDEDPEGLTVTFGGLLSGHQVTVSDPDGYFQYTVQVQGPGPVTAHTIDDDQQESNYAFYYLPQ